METHSHKRAVCPKAVKKRGSSPGDPLLRQGSGSETTGDINVGVKISHTISDEGASLDKAVNSDTVFENWLQLPNSPLTCCQECRRLKEPTL